MTVARTHSQRKRLHNVNQRYLSQRILAIMRQQTEEAAKHRVDVLRRVFLGDLPRQSEHALTEIRKNGVDGWPLVRRLEALQDRYRLTPPPADSLSNEAQLPRVIRVVCSDGLV